MTNLEMAKKNYARGLWTDDMIARLVKKSKLTAADYEEITGSTYTGKEAETITEGELASAIERGVGEA